MNELSAVGLRGIRRRAFEWAAARSERETAAGESACEMVRASNR